MDNIGDRVREALAGELRRQAEASDGKLELQGGEAAVLKIDGQVNLDELTMAVVGALAGGP